MASRVVNRVGELRRKYHGAILQGIDDTMAEAVDHAKANHAGWKSVTGKAEGSVKILRSAEERAGELVGRWGGDRKEAFYVLFLELRNGAFLRNAADAIYPRLAQNIRRAAGL